MSDSAELQEFAGNIEAEVTDKVHENSMDEASGNFREEVFTDLVMGSLVEFGAGEDVEVCFLDKKYGRGLLRVNAYSVNEVARKVLIVATIYLPDPLATVPRKDLELAIQRAARAFEAAGNAIHESMEPATDSFSMMQRLSDVYDDTLEVKILVITNGTAASSVEDVDLPEGSATFRWDVWDMVRLSRCMASGKSYESIEIDLTRMPTGPLPCLAMPETGAIYDAYLAIVPGDLLFRLYEEHGSKLLELNVRSFLQARGKVNRGIRDTIKTEPQRFLAYNNGISATAESIELSADGTKITKLTGFQIVNGGQTMASIHRARKVDQEDLDEVYVQAKITVVDPIHLGELVPKISRYANTQNKVNEADFSANDPFHVEIERFSEKIWCPGEQSRWFYERARGQYQVAKVRLGTTVARRRKFDEATPLGQKFDKVRLAKYVNSWDQLPHIVSRGGQKNFVFFMGQLKSMGEDWLPDELYYRRLISRAIIFKRAEKIARKHKFPSYRANAVAYTVALMSYKTIGRVDLESIWRHQEVPDPLYDTMNDWMPEIRDGLIESAGERNVTEWCKKEECWRHIQTLDVDVPGELQEELAEGQPLPTVGNIKGQVGAALSHVDRENIARTMQLSSDDWMKIHQWATATGKHFTVAGISLTLSGYAANAWRKVPSAKQARSAVKMIEQANDDGVFDDIDLLDESA